jgi:zinc transporter
MDALNDVVEERPPVGDATLRDATYAKSLGIVPSLVWAFWFHEDGTAEPLDVDKPIETHRDGWVWLHLNLTDARAAAWLDTAGLPPPAVTLLRSRETHQQLHAGGDCVYGIFSDLARTLEKPTDEIRHFRFIMTERILISGRHHSLSSVEAARLEIECGARRLPTVAGLLELIVERVVDAIDGLAEELARKIDAVEDRLISNKVTDERQKLARVRRTTVQIHRQLSGLRTLFHRLEREGVDRLKPTLRFAAGRLAQRLDALDHDIVELRDRAHLLQEEVGQKMMEETNNHLHVLSILTMLFLPPTLITGIFGMNTKGLPFTDNEWAFIYAALLLIGSSAAVLWMMRQLGIFAKK